MFFAKSRELWGWTKSLQHILRRTRMPKPNQISLQQLKQSIATEQQKREDVIEQGGRAYRLGIERGNNPHKELSSRELWNIGWDKAKKAHEALFPSRERRVS
jgi:hypothetical protein